MRQIKRLIYIILLNIIVSAATVVIVLIIWEHNHPPLSASGTPAVIFITQAENVPDSVKPASTNGITPIIASPDVSQTLQATEEIEMLVYKVKEGDTLGALSNQFNVKVGDIMLVNGLTDPDSIIVGQILYIPTAPLPTITPTRTATTVASATPRPSATPTHGPSATSTPTQISQKAQVIVENVIGAGVLTNEHVVLQRTGDGELSLAGWRLIDGAGNSYTFPQLTLYKGGSINLNTRQGEDTVLDLFWGLTTAIWKAGKTVSLYDAQNVLRASYTIR